MGAPPDQEVTIDSTPGTTQAGRLTRKNRAGLLLCGLLGAGDIASLGALAEQGTEVSGPPPAVFVAAAVLGVLTLVAVVVTWRTRSRLGARLVAATRVVSALTAVPAFFVESVSLEYVAGAAVTVLLTLLAVWLLVSPPRR